MSGQIVLSSIAAWAALRNSSAFMSTVSKGNGNFEDGKVHTSLNHDVKGSSMKLR